MRPPVASLYKSGLAVAGAPVNRAPTVARDLSQGPHSGGERKYSSIVLVLLPKPFACVLSDGVVNYLPS